MRIAFGLLFAMIVLAGQSARAQGTFSGYMFGDYYYNAARDTSFRSGNLANSAVNGRKDLQGFQLRRIYFAYDNVISEQFTSRFRLEADQVSNTVDGKFGVAVKDAFLRWKNIFSGSDLIFGLQPTPAFDISEAAWGYRSLEKTIMDLRGIVGSRDLGVALRGRIDAGGMFNYWLMIANGAGQKPELDKFKRYYLTFQILPATNLQITLYGDYNAAPNVNDPTSTSIPRATVSNSAMTGAVFVGYRQPDAFNFGVEGFMVSRANGMTDPASPAGALKNKASMGVSLFGSARLATDLDFVARFDTFDPNTDASASGDARNYIIGGLSYTPVKNVSIIPNVQVETYQSLPNGGRSIDPSVTGRITFYYIFL